MSARRLTLLIAVLTSLFVLGVALAVGGLLALRDPGVLVVCLVAATAGVLAAGLAYLAARAVGEDDADPLGGMPEAKDVEPRLPVPVRARFTPIHSLPVAELPAPYVAAVLKGLHASRARPASPHSLH